MITTFLFLVAYIYCNYCKNPSISNIITSDDCKYIILVAMIIMNIFTILYELERKDDISLVIIIFLLLGIYIVIIIKEENNIHYIFAAIVFLSIISFMLNILHVIIKKMIYYLFYFYYNLYCFYIVLHFINNKTKK
jgi:hypothetical protein